MSANGLVLTDSLFRPIFADPESIKILGYPNAVSHPESLESLLKQKILSFLQPEQIASSGSAITQFQSGKRRYLCRAFMLQNHWESAGPDPSIALLLERGLPGPPGSLKKRNRLGGLYEDPFSFSPDPRFYSFSRAHLDVLAALRSMIREGRGIGVLIGQAGAGKTILVNYLAETLRAEAEFASLTGMFENRSEMVRAVMGALGMPGMSSMPSAPGIDRDLAANLKRLEQWLLDRRLEGKRAVLFYDNAQDYDATALENLCLFSDLQAGGQALLQVIIAGRQGLIEKLSGPRLDTVGRKINVFCRLTPMDDAEVRNYVLHRLRIAGSTRQLFTAEAMGLIALYARGIPLNVNMICRHCIALASTVNMQMIDERLVDDAAYDLVLRSQPFTPFEDPGMPFDNPKGRERRLLRLVKK